MPWYVARVGLPLLSLHISFVIPTRRFVALVVIHVKLLLDLPNSPREAVYVNRHLI